MSNTTLLRYINSVKNNSNLSEKIKTDRLMNQLPIYLNQVLIGLLLSDGSLERSSPTSGVRLSISFGKIHEKYFYFIYDLFKNYVNTKPTCIKVYNKKTNTYNNVLKFKTISLPQLIYYYELFYVNGKKIIPSNIMELMTPVVLAHLIMGDGNLKLPDKITRIYTNSFIKIHVEMLALAITNILHINARVVHDRNDQYIIVISKTEQLKLKSLIKDHMDSSMFYKIDLDISDNNSNLIREDDKFNDNASFYKI